MTKAQQQFIQREGKDSRDFNTWYHADDVKRIVWSIFQKIPNDTKSFFLEPYVCFDDENPLSFDTTVELLKKQLLSSNKRYLPFIIKPEIGAAHYVAGVISQENNQASLFLFDPLAPKRGTIKNKLALEDANAAGQIPLFLSTETVQDLEKEAENKPVSCGVFAVLFIQACLEEHDWINHLHGNDRREFKLPQTLSQFTFYTHQQYREQLEVIRQQHYQLLGEMRDRELYECDESNAELTSLFIQAYENRNKNLSEDEDFSDDGDGISITESELYFNNTFDDGFSPPTRLEKPLHSYSNTLGKILDSQFNKNDSDPTQLLLSIPQANDNKLPTLTVPFYDSNEFIAARSESETHRTPFPFNDDLSIVSLDSSIGDSYSAEKLFYDDQLIFLKKTYFVLLEELKNKTKKLSLGGTPGSRYANLSCSEAADTLKKLHTALEEIAIDFFSNNLTPYCERLAQFQTSCQKVIAVARPELEKHRGYWNSIHPILKGILGVLAIIMIIPALIVNATARSGCIQTFFAKPATRSIIHLNCFEEKVDTEIFKPLSYLGKA